MIILIMASQSQEKNQDKLNNYILTFQLQKTTVNGVDGFFIPFEGYKQLLLYMNDYIYYQNLVIIKDDRIKQLEKFELTNFKLKTALGVAIAFDIGSLFLCAGLGVMCYNLALIK